MFLCFIFIKFLDVFLFVGGTVSISLGNIFPHFPPPLLLFVVALFLCQRRKANQDPCSVSSVAFLCSLTRLFFETKRHHNVSSIFVIFNVVEHREE